MDKLLQIIANHFGITIEQLLSGAHTKNIVEAKRMAILLLKERKYSHSVVRDKLRYKSKSTVTFHMDTTKTFLLVDRHFKENYTDINQKLLL